MYVSPSIVKLYLRQRKNAFINGHIEKASDHILIWILHMLSIINVLTLLYMKHNPGLQDINVECSNHQQNAGIDIQAPSVSIISKILYKNQSSLIHWVLLSTIISQITDNMAICSKACPGWNQRNIKILHNCSFVKGIHNQWFLSQMANNVENDSMPCHHHVWCCGLTTCILNVTVKSVI